MRASKQASYKPMRGRVLCRSLLLLTVFLATAEAQQVQLPESPAAPSLPGNFFQRLGIFYHQDWTYTTLASPTPERRGLPQPLASPPFPASDWSYGGSPTLGEPDGNSYPFMTALNNASPRAKLYGWVEPTVNGSTSGRSNAPVADDAYANRVELNQVVLYYERLPDTVQRDHFDYGFHLTALYGTDYRYTTDKGYLSFQSLKDGHQYGFDPSMEYLDLYLPHLGRSTNVRVGRFISVPGIEAQLSPNNYFFTHSLLYSVDPFTDTGILFTTQLSEKTLIQYGITAGHDVAPWTNDAKPSATLCLSQSTASSNDNVYLCANGINNGKYDYNNIQQYDATWYHKLSKNWHAATEAYVMYQRQVPAVGGPIAPELGSNGAACQPGEQRCFAPEWAIQNYFNRQLGAHNFIGFRSDFLNDKKGQRTGVATKYTENTVSFNHWIGTTIQFRPEVRFDHSWDRAGYDNGAHRSQFSASTDLILHF